MINAPEFTEAEIQAELDRMDAQQRAKKEAAYKKYYAPAQGSSLPAITQTQSTEAKAKIAQIKAYREEADMKLSALPNLQQPTIVPGEFSSVEEAQKKQDARRAELNKNLRPGSKVSEKATTTVGMPTNLADIENVTALNQAEIDGIRANLLAYKKSLDGIEQAYLNAGTTTKLPGIVPTFDEFQSLMTEQEQKNNLYGGNARGYRTSRGGYMTNTIIPDATITSKLPNIDVKPPKDLNFNLKQTPSQKYNEFISEFSDEKQQKTSSSTPRITSNIGTPEAVAGILDTYGNLKSVTNKAVSMINPSSDNYNTFNNAFFDVVKKTWGRNVGNNLSEVRVGAEQSLGRAIAAKDPDKLGQWAGLFSIDRDKGTVEFSPNMVKVKTDIEAKIYDKIKDYDYKKTRALFRQGFVDADKKGDFVLGNNAVEIDQAKRNYARLLTQAGMSSLFNPDARQKFEQLSTTPKSGK